ncbi:MAG: hypothetical protein A2946_02530 [Candidatus Liptonbacteria bacterium RIFCSPLOWO2_01_FULL_53_13]|uniref:Uncharacterized protein n=1 Tax=Candidatus Liptonbacteria bacterium RIFCSPLOWO2_01_FULL_53_13 TaxID=1798651 RepID=A0A1G2CLS1_9BACT|nr:MAG: hypothetical protein A2946_02530 [Candidatus Liptonbacteria bacterium RIFCSPLOWO2_01_FULL_53_13]
MPQRRRHRDTYLVFHVREGRIAEKVALLSAGNRGQAFEYARIATRGKQGEGEPLVARKLGRREVISLGELFTPTEADEERIARALQRRETRRELAACSQNKFA